MGFNLTVRQHPVLLGAGGTATLQKTAIVRDRPTGAPQAILVAGLSVMLIFAVLAFGSTEQWAIVVLEIGSALLLFFWIWPQISAGNLKLRANRLYAPILLFGLIIIVQVVFGLSAYVHVTRFELWKYAAYGSLFLLANQCEGIGTHRLLTILAAFGFVVALFALVQYLAYNGKIYWVWPALPNSFGPYVDNSHYAGLMEMLTPIPLAMALTDGARRQLLWMVAAILMAATIFVCGSRGGMTAFAIEIIFLGGLLVTRWNLRTAWTLFALCLAIGAFVFWIDGGRVLKQLDSLWDPLTNADVISRLAVARDLPRMLHDRLIAGWGLGLFPIIYPQYRSFSTDLVVNEAHNDYLQALVETGTLGFACILWFTVNLYHSGIRNFRANSWFGTTRALGPLVGCTGILVHSLSDFNMHIPANAALFCVLSGIATQCKPLGTRNKTS